MARRWTGPSASERRALDELSSALKEIGFALPGSVAVRCYPCGKPSCACHASPPRLHGPYIQWTRRVANKTVHVNLSPEQLADYQVFFENARRLRELVGRLEALTISVIETDPRFNKG